MNATSPIGEIDRLSVADITDLGSADGPTVSMFMPTHRHGPETLQAPIRLRNLIGTASRDLHRSDVPKAIIEDLLAPPRRLADDASFWQHQADGLAVFSAPGHFWRFRVPLPLAEEATVAASFRVRPLLPLLNDEAFFVLSLSQNALHLFEATRYTIGPLEPDLVPGSMAEALAHEDPESQLQFHSSGGEMQYHGHGVGAEIDKAALERYLRAVEYAVTERLGGSRQPLVLACVGYYLPIYQSVNRYPTLVDRVVEGNPEHRSPAELHAAAWELIEPLLARGLESDLERFRNAAGTGKAITAIEEVVSTAREGRVETLFVTGGPARWGRVAPDTGEVTITTEPSIAEEDLVDRAVLDTLGRGGIVRFIDAGAIDADTVVAALLRY
jgi:hypothetical protein